MPFDIFNLTTHESFVAIAYSICGLVVLGLIITIQRDGTIQRKQLAKLQVLETNLNQNQDENSDETKQ